MNTIEKLTEIFKEFPGIGERQAKRFVYFLMSKNGEYSENLSALIKELKKDTVQCSECFKFFISASKKEKKCEICADPNIDPSTLMIVEKDSDLESVNKSRIFNGKNFILGGREPILEKNTSSGEKKKKIFLFFYKTHGDNPPFFSKKKKKKKKKPPFVKKFFFGGGPPSRAPN